MKVRKSCFVCASVTDNKIINKSVVASSKEEASSLFIAEFGAAPTFIEGPFYQKRVIKPKVVKKVKKIDLKFGTETKKAIYKDFLVNAFLLIEPKDYAYIVVIKSLDESINKPKEGTIVVPVDQLKMIEETI